MATEQEHADAEKLLATSIGEGITWAFKNSPTPQLVLAKLPVVLTGLAGSYVLQMLRTRMLADGEVDRLLAVMAKAMRAHADPELNPDADPMPTDKAGLLRRIMRGLIVR